MLLEDPDASVADWLRPRQQLRRNDSGGSTEVASGRRTLRP